MPDRHTIHAGLFDINAHTHLANCMHTRIQCTHKIHFMLKLMKSHMYVPIHRTMYTGCTHNITIVGQNKVNSSIKNSTFCSWDGWASRQTFFLWSGLLHFLWSWLLHFLWSGLLYFLWSGLVHFLGSGLVHFLSPSLPESRLRHFKHRCLSP